MLDTIKVIFDFMPILIAFFVMFTEVFTITTALGMTGTASKVWMWFIAANSLLSYPWSAITPAFHTRSLSAELFSFKPFSQPILFLMGSLGQTNYLQEGRMMNGAKLVEAQNALYS